MNTRWFYKHAGHTFGPYGGDDLYRLAAMGLLQPADPLWPEGSDPQGAVEATAAIDFTTLPAPQLDPPDWLTDVAESQRSGPQPTEWPAHGTPDWVEDMRRIEQPTGAKRPIESVASNATTPAMSAAAPEQVESSEALYRRARAALHAWAGMEANKALILSGDFDAVRQDAAVQLILRQADQCGPHFAARFGKYLEFVVHSRRKYYLAAV